MERNLRQRVGDNIRRLRLKRGLSLQGLADLCDMEKSNLVPLEQGRINMTLDTIARVAAALGVDPRELFKV